jgi:hypothetical protein
MGRGDTELALRELAAGLMRERDRLHAENTRLREQLREMAARAMGHAYTAEMAEGGESIQHQELQYERRQHAQTLAQLRRYEGALMSISKNTCCASCGEAKAVALTALSESDSQGGDHG